MASNAISITEERLLEMGYGSKNIHLILSLWYPAFTYTPAFDNNLPQADHIFPQSLLKAQKITNGASRPTMRYRDGDRNQLANCMMLTR